MGFPKKVLGVLRDGPEGALAGRSQNSPHPFQCWQQTREGLRDRAGIISFFFL